MKASTWNLAFFGTLTVLVLALSPLMTVAFGGGFDDFGSGGFDFFGGGGFDDFGFGGFDDFGTGGFDDFGTGLPGSPDDSTGGDGFNPFDDDFNPFDGNPGPGPGPDDFNPDDDGDFPGDDDVPPVCFVNCGSNGITPSSREKLSIFIHRVIIPNAFEQYGGDVLPIRVIFENNGDRELKDTKVIGMIPELSLRFAQGPFDLKRGDRMSQLVLLELPHDVEPGEYLVRFQIVSDTPDSDDRIIHRHVEVVNY